MKGKGLCQWIAGALGKNPQRAKTPALRGSGNIVNINIKTSNETFAVGPEGTPLRALKPKERSELPGALVQRNLVVRHNQFEV
jgi:hypothetical protein